ncbi:hypothetical protein BOTNAR_0018g00180 [Botryotinia narcissicola]|uniref:Uncharacterized protein n=1 Tax=Botryotinia narcissicola TaxID=278944 RepID=A0A4Z1J5Q1_9HELO|nr:hypothetical protein BOTNAR_0018g00180 [Botryotinia narcissicola]
MPSNMEISTSLTAVKKLLTFHDLSSEIRNKIYELLLCDFEEAEVLFQFPGLMPNYQISGLSALFGSVSALFSPLREIKSFLSRKQQEELIAPYRAHLKAFPNLEFNGVIPKDLQTIATSVITFVPEVYSQEQVKEFRDNVERMMKQGRRFFDGGDFLKAIKMWNKCQKLICSPTLVKRGERLLKGLPVEYLKSLEFIVFEIACDRAEITSYLMQTKWEGHHEKIFMEAKSIQKAERRYDKIAKRYYHLSIAFRQSGHLEWASEVIERALGEEPDDSELLIERGNVSLAISEEARRKLMNENRLLSLRRLEMN